MEREAKTTAFSALAAELSAATVSATEQLPTLRATLRRFAALSFSVVELWRVDGDPTLDDAGWRLLAVEQAPLPGAIPAALTPPLDDLIRSVAFSRQLFTVDAPTPTLALPLIAWDRVQGVLLVRAIRVADDLVSWQPPLAQLAPLLALCLCSLSPEGQRLTRAAGEYPLEPVGRACLLEQLERELARARRSRQAFAVLLLGLDRFDALRQAVGTAGQERALGQLGTALRATCRDGDLMRRYSRDCFLLLLPDSDSQGASFVARRYLDHLYRRPLAVHGHEPLYLDFSIGIALFPVDGLTPTELVDSAAEALVSARRLGGRRAVAA